MKKSILLLVSVLVFATGCYDDYVYDYETTGVYVAYQYNLRTFVLDDGEAFKFTVALGGVMKNERSRKVGLVSNPSLISGALDAMNNNKLVSGEYVTQYMDTSKLDITDLVPLKMDNYTIEGMDNLVISKGRHTASITLRATEQMRTDPNMFRPYYAVAFGIVSADADVIVQGKDFGVVAVRCENKFYGNWDSTYEVKGTGSVTKSVRELITVDAETLLSNGVAGEAGQMIFRFTRDESGKLSQDFVISSEDSSVEGTGRFNGNRLLQARELHLEYSYTDQNGVRRDVTEDLKFRNRYRDGVNEYQDENPEHYN